MRYISAEQIRAKVSMEQAIELMEPAFVALSSAQAVVPQRVNMPLEPGDCALVMPVYLKGGAHYGVKTVSINQHNPCRGLPRLHAVMTLFDAVNGSVLAAMDGDAITEIRTGAASALATRLLADTCAQTLALFGTGAQAQAQLAGVAAVRSIRRVLIFATSMAKAKAFIDSVATDYAFEFIAASSPEQLLEADIVCTATSSKTPVFSHRNLADIVHINGVGSYQRNMAELDRQTVLSSTVVVDQRSACLQEAGDIVQAATDKASANAIVDAELGELIARTIALPEPGGRTLFKSVGNAVQDLVLASYIYGT